LYFADLGGQVFRADLNNRSQLKANNLASFGKRVVRLADLVSSSKRPRFYEAPAVTIHDEGAQRFAVVSIGSGDRSSPLNKTAFDNNVYGLIDRDVARTNLYSLADDKLYTSSKLIASFKKNPTNADQVSIISDMSDAGTVVQDIGGWYYQLGAASSGLKAFDAPIAINGDLYVTVFSPTTATTTSACTASVAGESSVYRFCLPYGICSDIGTNTDGFFKFKLGAGIQGATIGAGDANSATRRLIFNQPDVTKTTNNEPDKLRLFSTPRKLVPTRWYEKLPK
jgi:type IV pilus assembly protein PilY1